MHKLLHFLQGILIAAHIVAMPAPMPQLVSQTVITPPVTSIVSPTIPVVATISTSNNQTALNDFEEKQYIQSLVSDYKNTEQKIFYDSSNLLSENAEINALNGQITNLQNIDFSLGYCYNDWAVNCPLKPQNYPGDQTPTLPAHNLISKNEKTINSDVSEMESLEDKNSAESNSFPSLKNPQYDGVFCSLPQIPSSYESYCLSLFN